MVEPGRHARLRPVCRKAWEFDSPRAHVTTSWGRSSVGRASHSHREGRRFDSVRLHSSGQRRDHADVAQWLEHPTVDRGAAGSIPVVGAHEGLAESGRWRRVASAERGNPSGVRISHPSPSRRSSARVEHRPDKSGAAGSNPAVGTQRECQPGDRAGPPGPSRIVRAPQGRVVPNGNPVKAAGKCHREQTAGGSTSGEGETVW